jgi:hypothetical protein
LGDAVEIAEFRVANQSILSNMNVEHHSGRARILNALYRNLAVAELKAPLTSRGAFIPAGAAFDAFIEIGKVLKAARNSITIVDPYLDEIVITDFATLAPQNVRINLLTDSKKHKESLLPAVKRWNDQHEDRTITVRCCLPPLLHDRLIFIDDNQTWNVSQSFKDFAKTAHASIVRLEGPLLEDKLSAYRQIWETAETK